MELVKSYLQQGSTYRGLALILSLAGIHRFSEEEISMLQAVGEGVVGALGLYGVFRNEHAK